MLLLKWTWRSGGPDASSSCELHCASSSGSLSCLPIWSQGRVSSAFFADTVSNPPHSEQTSSHAAPSSPASPSFRCVVCASCARCIWSRFQPCAPWSAASDCFPISWFLVWVSLACASDFACKLGLTLWWCSCKRPGYSWVESVWAISSCFLARCRAGAVLRMILLCQGWITLSSYRSNCLFSWRCCQSQSACKTSNRGWTFCYTFWLSSPVHLLHHSTFYYSTAPPASDPR